MAPARLLRIDRTEERAPRQLDGPVASCDRVRQLSQTPQPPSNAFMVAGSKGHGSPRSTALIVPTEVVQHGQNGLYVFIVDDQNRA